MMNPVQRAISLIGTNEWNSGRHVTVDQLRVMLLKYGLKPGKGRGIYRQISTAYTRSVEEGNQGAADCICCCFVNSRGEHVYH